MAAGVRGEARAASGCVAKHRSTRRAVPRST